MKKFHNKGFSVVEVVIALTVISIVTITAISITSLSSKNTQAFLNKADAQYLVADAIECFKAIPCSSIDDYEDFCDKFFRAFEFRGGLSSYGVSEIGYKRYMMDNGCYYVEVMVVPGAKRISLFISVIDLLSGNVIVGEEYFKSVYEVIQ